MIEDNGKLPMIINLTNSTNENENFRTTIWTGEEVQVTMMSIQKNDDIGLEVHEDTEQVLHIVSGRGLCKLGRSKDKFDLQQEVSTGHTIFVPKGYWHNILNIGDEDLKIHTTYAEPEHDPGTIHSTHNDAELAELNESTYFLN